MIAASVAGGAPIAVEVTMLAVIVIAAHLTAEDAIAVDAIVALAIAIATKAANL